MAHDYALQWGAGLSIKIFANFISFADMPASEALFKMFASAKLAAANFFLCSNCSANLKFFY